MQYYICFDVLTLPYPLQVTMFFNLHITSVPYIGSREIEYPFPSVHYIGSWDLVHPITSVPNIGSRDLNIHRCLVEGTHGLNHHFLYPVG